MAATRLLFLAASLMLFAVAQARAATAIYHSAAENIYGWCGGYASARAASCAEGYCVQNGGTACELVVECRGGWGAIAVGRPGFGAFAAVCDLGDATSARRVALAACLVESRTLCHIATTFDRRGNTLSTESDLEFGRVWQAQLLMQLADIYDGDSDGENGPATTAAVKEFQSRLGREATGALDDELLARLVDAEGGEQFFAARIDRDLLSRQRNVVADVLYSHAEHPAPTMTFSEDLEARSEGDRLLALAAMIAAEGVRCSLPAVAALLIGGADDETATWQVTCNEGAYLLVRTADGATTILSN